MLSPVFIVARPLGRHPSMHMHQSTPVVRPQIACEASGSDQASNSERGFGKVRDQSEKAPGGHRTAGRDGSGKGGRGGSGGRVSRPAKDSASGPGQAPSKVGANRASRRAAERAEAAAADGASVASRRLRWSISWGNGRGLGRHFLRCNQVSDAYCRDRTTFGPGRQG